MRRRITWAAVLSAMLVLTVGSDVRGQSEESGGDGAASSEDSAGELPAPEDVVETLDTLYRSNSSRAVMSMTVEKPRNSRELVLESWSKGEDRMLVVIQKPAREAGTATLRTPDGLWNYLPRADRLMRIPSGMLSDSWMGSHFSNDDLVRESNYDEDFEGEVARAEHDGDDVLELTLTAKPDAPVVYSKIVFYVTPGDWVPIEQNFYDDGEVIRTMKYSDVETVDGKKLPMTLTLRPSDAEDEFTKLTYEELEFGVDLDKKLFSKRGLRRRAK